MLLLGDLTMGVWNSPYRASPLSPYAIPKFGWTGKGDETAVAWKGDDGDEESEDVDARVSSKLRLAVLWIKLGG